MRSRLFLVEFIGVFMISLMILLVLTDLFPYFRLLVLGSPAVVVIGLVKSSR